MVLSSITFLFYILSVVLTVEDLLPRLRNGILLVASLFFYAWGETSYVLVLLAWILFNYAAGMAMAGSKGGSRRASLTGGVVANLVLLGFFKHAKFLGEAPPPF